jgi:hypothetical protein
MTEESKSKSVSIISNQSSSLPLDCSRAVTGVWLVKVIIYTKLNVIIILQILPILKYCFILFTNKYQFFIYIDAYRNFFLIEGLMIYDSG